MKELTTFRTIFLVNGVEFALSFTGTRKCRAILRGRYATNSLPPPSFGSALD
jgi:hypothetical protein